MWDPHPGPFMRRYLHAWVAMVKVGDLWWATLQRENILLPVWITSALSRVQGIKGFYRLWYAVLKTLLTFFFLGHMLILFFKTLLLKMTCLCCIKCLKLERTPWTVSTFLPEWSTLIHYFFAPWGVEGNSWKEWPLVLNQHTRRDTTHMTERNLLHWKGSDMPPQTGSTTLTVTAVSIGAPLSKLFLRNQFFILVGRVSGEIYSVPRWSF